MNSLTWVALIASLVAIGAVIFLLIREKTTQKSLEDVPLMDELRQFRRDAEALHAQLRTELQQRLDATNDRLFRSASEQTGQLQTNLSKTSDMIQGLVSRFTTQFGEQSTQFQVAQKQILEYGSQLADLQDILKNPKHRGILGEYFLETVLGNVLQPEGYKMQYKFKDGEIVDAAVFVKDKIIPIDSKFSLENYNRLVEEKNPVEHERLEKLFVNDLKERIKETAKYIRPEEGTVDFAFMFIPHEAIYYDLLINKIGAVTENTESIIQRAAGTYRVIVVSPTSFLAYLQTVLQGLKSLQIEEQAKEIKQRVEELGKHLKVYEEFHGKLGNALSTAANHYNIAGKAFRLMDKDVLRIAGVAPGLETPIVDRPELDA